MIKAPLTEAELVNLRRQKFASSGSDDQKVIQSRREKFGGGNVVSK